MRQNKNARPPQGEPGAETAAATTADTYNSTTASADHTMPTVGPAVVRNMYNPAPIRDREKRPKVLGWEHLRLTAADCAKYPGCGVGILTGQGDVPIVALDLDSMHPHVAEAFEAWALAHLGQAPVRIGQAPKRLLVYRAAEAGWRKRRSRQYTDADGNTHHLETLGAGQQFVAYGIHPGTGRPYEWTDLVGGLTGWPAASLAVVTEDQVGAALAEFERLAEVEGLTPAKAAPRTGAVLPRPDDPFAGVDEGPTDHTPEQVADLLRGLDSTDYDQWLRVGMALHHQTEGSDDGLDLWDDWSAESANYKGRDDLAYRWKGFAPSPGVPPTTLRSVIKAANEAKAEAAKAATIQARATMTAAIAACDDPDDLLGATARDAGWFAQDSPALRVELEAALRGRFKELTGQRLPVKEVRTAMVAGGANTSSTGGGVVLDPADPMRTAREFLNRREGRIVRHQGGFYGWAGGYRLVDKETLEGEVWSFTSSAVIPSGEPFKPTRNIVADVVAALRSVARVDIAGASGWIDGHTEPPPADLVVFQNGMLNLKTAQLELLTSDYFTTAVLPFSYDPTAHAPAWDKFTISLWKDDRKCRDLLCEIMGYLVAGGTNMQKIFLMIGPSRAGKGVIARIITAMMGPGGMCAPTLSSLATNFGLAPLVGKTVAIIGDARLRGNADQAAIAERLLSISGEDQITVPRKYRDSWTGRLDSRFVLISNELPRIGDASGALARRFVILPFTRSFLDKEDTGLTDRLMAELPGIFNWALGGLDDLHTRGHFQPVASADDLTADLMGLTSPVSRFIADKCEEGVGHTVATIDLYDAWRCWCADHGHQPGTDGTFGRDLSAVLPALKKTRPRLQAGSRVWQYIGLRLLHLAGGRS